VPTSSGARSSTAPSAGTVSSTTACPSAAPDGARSSQASAMPRDRAWSIAVMAHALHRARRTRPGAARSLLRGQGDERGRLLEIVRFLALGRDLDPAVDALFAFLNGREVEDSRFGRQAHAEAELVEISVRQRPAPPRDLVDHLRDCPVRP